MARFGDLEAAIMDMVWAATAPVRVRQVSDQLNRDRSLAGVPADAPGAGGSAAAQRISRLIAPPLRGSLLQRAVTSAALAAVAALAVAVLALAFVTISRCPPGLYTW